MRAIKFHELLAIRDNKNHWRISQNDLDSWRLHTVRTVDDAHTLHTHEALEIERLKGEVDAERRLREAVEADRDRWQAMAEKLADQKPRRGLWFWRR